MAERHISWALFDIDNPETLAALLNGRQSNLGIGFMGSDGTRMIVAKMTSDGKVETTATLSGDVNVDETTPDNSGYIGKEGGVNADFTTAYAGVTTFTCASLPDGLSAIGADDIFTIVQIDNTGAVVTTYTRDNTSITASGTDPSTITVTGAVFAATDTFVVYTNIKKAVETEGTPDSVAAAKIAQMGGIATALFPDEVDEGDAVALLMDLIGRQIIAGYNPSVTALDTNPIADGVTMTMNTGPQTTLTAPGDGDAVGVADYHHHTLKITVVWGGAATYVDIALFADVDGTGFGNAEASNPPAIIRFANDGVNTVFFMTLKGKYEQVKPVFDDEGGDTDSTVTFSIMSGN